MGELLRVRRGKTKGKVVLSTQRAAELSAERSPSCPENDYSSDSKLVPLGIISRKS